MTKIIRLYGLALVPPDFGAPPAYLAAFDADQNGLDGMIVITNDPSRAMHFADPGDALACWKRQSATMPTRPDGRPNRPLTAFHAEIMDSPVEGTDENPEAASRKH